MRPAVGRLCEAAHPLIMKTTPTLRVGLQLRNEADAIIACGRVGRTAGALQRSLSPRRGAHRGP